VISETELGNLDIMAWPYTELAKPYIILLLGRVCLMAFRLISSLMLLVLLWTGTLLHDIAEEDGHQFASQSTHRETTATKKSACYDLAQSSSEELEHCYLACTARQDVNAAWQPVLVELVAIIYAPWVESFNSGCVIKLSRAPPNDLPTRLYLVNRHLLI
jgi:hypothetical protein